MNVCSPLLPRYTLLPQSSITLDAADSTSPPTTTTYTISLQSVASRKKATSTFTSPKRLLASGLQESDVQFDKDGICVWLNEEEANAAPTTGQNVSWVMTVDGGDGAPAKRTRWFCHVTKWRLVETLIVQ